MGSFTLTLGLPDGCSNLAQSVPVAPIPVQIQGVNVQRLAQQTTVRILTPFASGSGAIVDRQGQLYTFLTNWHVVAFSSQHKIITPDGRQYTTVSGSLKQIGNTDLAIAKFKSAISYQVAQISYRPVVVGEQVFAAGFPMYQGRTLATTFKQGIRAFRFTRGEVSLLPPKSLAQGYRLGYTNDVVVGMSGGPIFNSNGFLIGINGRVKNRDPGFGVYAFEDGTEPSPELLAQMESSSWGIPINTYLQFQGRTSPPTPLLPGEGRTSSPVSLLR